MEKLAKRVKSASFQLQSMTTHDKNLILQSIHNQLTAKKKEILEKNELDLNSQKDKISKQLFKRLDLAQKYNSLCKGVIDVMNLEDPNQKVLLARELDKDLELFKVSCPVGVILIIFEARPEVVVQISCLAIKSGNAVILKGGKEANNSNEALFSIIQNAIEDVAPGMKDIVQLVTQREEISTLLRLDEYIDLVIPRGSNELVKYVQQNTSIPVIGHSDGICSVYVDKESSVDIATRVIVDGKLAKVLNSKQIRLASAADFKTEFLDLIIAIQGVDSMQSAINHINYFGSHHTDCIVTENQSTADQFMKKVDAAGVYWNASTRFADGFRYGFGAEIGVSTNKTHARGPVGLEGLMIYKYRLYGNGHQAGEFGQDKKGFSHKDLGLKYGQKVINDMDSDSKSNKRVKLAAAKDSKH